MTASRVASAVGVVTFWRLFMCTSACHVSPAMSKPGFTLFSSICNWSFETRRCSGICNNFEP